MPDENLGSILESLLLVAGGPVSVRDLATAARFERRDVEDALGDLRRRLDGGIRLQLHGDEAQLVTAPENLPFVHAFLGTSKPPALSRPALEALAIVAYQQPVTRQELESMRGVNSDRVVQTLLARGLIAEAGLRESLGRPMQYRTTAGFLEYFGLTSLDELPSVDCARPDTSLPPGSIGLRPPDREGR